MDRRMKWITNLIILSLLISVAALSQATTELVDPTRPANYVEKAAEVSAGEKSEVKKQSDDKEVPIPDFTLNAIKIGRSSRMAIINGETLMPGQEIGSAKLVRINSNSVVMTVNGKAVTVSLLPDSIKTRSAK